MNDSTDERAQRVEEALAAVGLGFAVFPVWPTDPDGVCRCPQAKKCGSPGKHPFTKRGFLDATRDPERVRTFLMNEGGLNWGAVWPEGDEVVLSWDLDGEDWRDRLVDLTTTHGPLPPTRTTITPSGGRHAYYRWPAGLPIPTGNTLHAFIVRWPMKGYVVGPGSRINGSVYTTNGLPIADLPERWTNEEVGEAKHRAPGVTAGDDWVWDESMGSRHDLLTSRIRYWRGAGVTGDALRQTANDFIERHRIPLTYKGRTITAKEIEDLAKGAEEKFPEDEPQPMLRVGRGKRKGSLPARVYEPRPAGDDGAVNLGTVPITRTEWLWKGWLPIGEMAVVEGLGGTGKSTFVVDLAFRLTRRAYMADRQPNAFEEQRTVLLIGQEDDPSSALIPRLIAAGADINRVWNRKDWRVPGDIPSIRAFIEKNRPSLVVIDPLGSHLDDGLDMNSDLDMRFVFDHLRPVAKETRTTFVISRHLNKKAGDDINLRGSGSYGGITGAVRVVIHTMKDPESEGDDLHYLVGVIKSNYGKMPKPLRFAIRAATVPYVNQFGDDDEAETSVIEWEGEADKWMDDYNAMLLSKRATKAASTRFGEAHNSIDAELRELLEEGPVEADLIKGELLRRGYNETAIKRSCLRVGIVSKRQGFPARAVWSLADDKRSGRQGHFNLPGED